MVSKEEDDVMPKDSETEYLEDDAEYSRKSDFSKALITQEQVNRCLVNRSKDMRAGFTTWASDKFGNLKPQIITDSRKEFCGSVEALKNLLYPEIELSKEFSEMIEEYETEKERLFQLYAYRERISKKDGKWIFSSRVFMPQLGSPILGNSPESPQSDKVKLIERGWDNSINLYWDEMVEICDELFAELNKLIHKNNYFKQGISW